MSDNLDGRLDSLPQKSVNVDGIDVTYAELYEWRMEFMRIMKKNWKETLPDHVSTFLDQNIQETSFPAFEKLLDAMTETARTHYAQGLKYHFEPDFTPSCPAFDIIRNAFHHFLRDSDLEEQE